MQPLKTAIENESITASFRIKTYAAPENYHETTAFLGFFAEIRQNK